MKNRHGRTFREEYAYQTNLIRQKRLQPVLPTYSVDGYRLFKLFLCNWLWLGLGNLLVGDFRNGWKALFYSPCLFVTAFFLSPVIGIPLYVLVWYSISDAGYRELNRIKP